MSIAQVLAACLFLLAASLQWNDPDPHYWLSIYALAAASCLACALDRRQRWLCAITLVWSLGWAAVLAPQVIGAVSFPALFQGLQMQSESIELGREFGGLAIISLWMLVCLLSPAVNPQSTTHQEAMRHE